MRLVQVPYNGFKLWISADETYEWAKQWPCSTLRNKRIFAEFAANGDLVDIAINGRLDADCDIHEFNALTSDFIARKLPGHPAIKLPVGES